jgi:uncharacterized protein
LKSIGTAQVIQGEKTKGYLHVGSDTDGSEFQIPVLVAAGKSEGPTIWVQGCIHGEEYGGAASIIRFFQELEPKELRGTFIGIPVTNLPSFKARSRISPLDGANLNRIFPGDPKGTYSQRLAHSLLHTVLESADYVIDLHSGGIGCEVPFYMICKDDGSSTAKKSMWLAERMGSKVIWRSTGAAGTGGSGSAHYVKNGIPTVTVECGGGNVTEEHETQFKAAIANAMKALDMLDGSPVVQQEYTVIHKGDFIFTGEGGLFVPNCNVGDVLQSRDLIGTIINLFGDVTEEIRCPSNHSYIAAIGHRYWPTDPGELIAEAIPLESSFTE